MSIHKVLVTGASGFVGGYIARRLLGRGYKVQALAQQGLEHLVPKGCEVITGDLRNDESVNKCIQGCDAVVHAAYLGDYGITPEEHFLANVVGSYRLLDKARISNVSRFIYISSMAVYSYSPENMLYRPVDENHPTWGTSLYAACKLAIEAYCRSYYSTFGLNTTIIRPGQVYGIQRAEQFYWLKLAQEVISRPSVKVTGGGMIVAADDVAEIVAVMLERQDMGGEIYNAVDFFLSWEEYAKLVKKKAGTNTVIEAEEIPPDHFLISNDKIRKLGISLKGMAGLESFVEEILHLAQRKEKHNNEISN